MLEHAMATLMAKVDFGCHCVVRIRLMIISGLHVIMEDVELIS